MSDTTDFEPEDPSEYAKDVILKAALFRGSIITSYAQVEMLLADLVMRCRVRPDYAGVYDRFPYRLEHRIKAARRIFAHDGPLRIYREDAEKLVDGLLQFEEFRHFMAHGLLIVTTDRQETHKLTYRLYRPTKGGEAEAGIMSTNLAELDRAFAAIGQYSNDFVRLFRRIYLEQGLEAV